MFRNTGEKAVPKNQTRLAYEDKRDLYCMYRYVFDECGQMTMTLCFVECPCLHDCVYLTESARNWNDFNSTMLIGPTLSIHPTLVSWQMGDFSILHVMSLVFYLNRCECRT